MEQTTEMEMQDATEELRYADSLFRRSFDGPENAKEEQREQLLGDLRYIRDRYGFRPRMHEENKADRGRKVEAEQMTFEEAVEAVRMLREELAKYPPEMLRRSGITHFRIVEELKRKRNGTLHEVDGLAFEEGEIYVECGDNKDKYKQTIHHELWHRLDYERFEAEDKVPFGYWLDEYGDYRIDRQWKKVNRIHGKRYLGKKWKKTPGGIAPEGYANRYGQKNSKEDRATFAQYMMVYPKELAIACEHDDLRRKKVDMMKELYLQDSGGRMNVRYFQDLAEGKVNEAYWDNKEVK